MLSRYTNSQAGLQHFVESVVDKAVNLAQLMAKCKANWICRLPMSSKTQLSYGFDYQKKNMRKVLVMEGGRKNIVDLVCRPSMRKYGGLLEGETRYDIFILKEKASVCVCDGGGPRVKGEADPEADYD